MKTVGIYCGSFDPIHNGHLDIVDRACRIFDEVHVVIGVNPDKKGIFTFDERRKIINEAIAYVQQHKAETDLRWIDKAKIQVVEYTGLIANYGERHPDWLETNRPTLVRGMRPVDGPSEMMMAQLNSDLGMDTIIFPCRKDLAHISSSAIKEILRHDIKALVHKDYVPAPVYDSLIRRISGLYEVGTTN